MPGFVFERASLEGGGEGVTGAGEVARALVEEALEEGGRGPGFAGGGGGAVVGG